MSQEEEYSPTQSDPGDPECQPAFPADSWGCLEQTSPHSSAKKFIYFSEAQNLLGRQDYPRQQILKPNEQGKVVIHPFSDKRVSHRHAIIKLVMSSSGTSDFSICAFIHSLTDGRTSIGGHKLSKGDWKQLRDGTSISLASDLTFIFRLRAGQDQFEPIRVNNKFYHISKSLGRGAQGTVCAALCCETSETVAIKSITYSPNSPRSVYERELNALKKLSHPHIVQFFDAGDRDDVCHGLHLVIEYVSGGNLHDLLTIRKGGLSEVESRRYTYEILTAVSYVHAAGIAHRDLKPQNILLTSQKIPHIKIADFGLAKDVSEGSLLKTKLGTPIFAAPEVFNASSGPSGTNKNPPLIATTGVYGTAVDCWAIGVILVVMLTSDYKIWANPTALTSVGFSRRNLLIRKVTDQGVSRHCVEVINTLVVDDPRKRSTAKEALSKSWFEWH